MLTHLKNGTHTNPQIQVDVYRYNGRVCCVHCHRDAAIKYIVTGHDQTEDPYWACNCTAAIVAKAQEPPVSP